MNAIEDHNKLLKKIIMEIDKYSPMDHIFNYMKKFEIIIKLHFSYLNNFLEKSRNIIEHLKTSIDSNISIISQFLKKNTAGIELISYCAAKSQLASTSTVNN